MTFVAACLQLCSSTDVDENISTVEMLARRAKAEGADYVQTPEMTNVVQRSRRQLFEVIDTESEDRAVKAFSALARELGVVLHIGSLALAAGDDKIANRAIIFGRDGSVLCRYNKIHLFDVDLPNGESWRESSVYVPGDRAETVDLDWCRLGIAICYDLRFPVLFRDLARAGASVLTAPSAFTRQTGEAHWNVLQRARAIENGAFMISAAQAGLHDDGRETYGHSIIVDPWGVVLAEAGGEAPDVIVAEIDPAKSTDARERIPSHKNERNYAGPGATELAMTA